MLEMSVFVLVSPCFYCCSGNCGFHYNGSLLSLQTTDIHLHKMHCPCQDFTCIAISNACFLCGFIGAVFLCGHKSINRNEWDFQQEINVLAHVMPCLVFGFIPESSKCNTLLLDAYYSNCL